MHALTLAVYSVQKVLTCGYGGGQLKCFTTINYAYHEHDYLVAEDFVFGHSGGPLFSEPKFAKENYSVYGVVRTATRAIRGRVVLKYLKASGVAPK